MITRDDVLGAWHLVSFIAEADGEVTEPLGAEPVGVILYTSDGYMSAQLMRRDRPAYAKADITGGTTEQMALAAGGYLAYSGPFDLDETTGVVRHHVTVALLPNWVNGTQVRQGLIDGDTLTLSADSTSRRGVTTHSTLVWRRAQTR
jgi:hypothetical protein